MIHQNVSGYTENRDEEHEKRRAWAEEQAKIIIEKYNLETKDYLHEDRIVSNIIFHGVDMVDRRYRRLDNPDDVQQFEAFRDHIQQRLGIGEYTFIPTLEAEDEGTILPPGEVLGQIKNFDWNQHLNYDEKHRDQMRLEALQYTMGPMLISEIGWYTDEDWELIREFLKDPSNPIPRWVTLGEDTCLQYCHHCSQNLQLETDGHTIRMVGPCSHPNGISSYDVEVDFPTGKVVVCDDLRPWFREAFVRVRRKESGETLWQYTFDRVIGKINVAREYAQDNYMTGFCGNTCPGVWQSEEEPTKFLIANPPYEGELLDQIPGYKPIAGIFTDLWWYSLADLQYVETKVPLFRTFDPEKGEMILSPMEEEYSSIPGKVIEVPPGRYRCTNHYEAVGNNYDRTTPTIYAEIVRVGDCKGD
jgi:hypothetical protein